MCGIVGYISIINILSNLSESLKEMEYRGYDSSGIAIITSENTVLYKETCKLQNLVKATNKFTKSNTHPHNGKHIFIA